MKRKAPEQLPIQNMLHEQQVAVFPLQTYASALSEVPHRHGAYMLMYVAEANGGNNQIDFRRYEMQTGRLFLVGPGQTHLRQAKQEKGMLVIFSESFLHTTGITAHEELVLFGAVYQHPYLDLGAGLRQKFTDITSLMEQELQEAKPDSAILSRYLYILLHYLLRECRVQIAKVTPARYSELLFRLSLLVEQHYKTHQPVSFYAATLGITAKHLNTICRNYLQTSMAEMLHARLILESKRLLYFSSLSVKEIGYELGFEDDSYFVRFFKRMTGVTPVQLREKGA